MKRNSRPKKCMWQVRRVVRRNWQEPSPAWTVLIGARKCWTESGFVLAHTGPHPWTGSKPCHFRSVWYLLSLTALVICLFQFWWMVLTGEQHHLSLEMSSGACGLPFEQQRELLNLAPAFWSWMEVAFFWAGLWFFFFLSLSLCSFWSMLLEDRKSPCSFPGHVEAQSCPEFQ